MISCRLAARSLCSSSTGFLLKGKLPHLFKGCHKTRGDTTQLWHPPQRHLCVLPGLGARSPDGTNFLPVCHMEGRAAVSAGPLAEKLGQEGRWSLRLPQARTAAREGLRPACAPPRPFVDGTVRGERPPQPACFGRQRDSVFLCWRS